MRPTAVLLLLAPLLGAAQEPASARPNLLWITCEDISPNLGCFGDSYAVTPNLDRLAREGVRYTRAFAPIGVCAPSRSSLFMGAYAPAVGSQHMRCKIRLPDSVKGFPEYLRNAGYYTSNNVKTDYNFEAPRSAWDENAAKVDWRGRKAGQPFFSVINLTSCHESQIRVAEAAHRKRLQEIAPLEAHDPAKAVVPPYHPDTPEVRRDWSRYADAITYMDKEAGEILARLEADGLAQDTIVMWFSDHGAGMPRSKRWLYDTSLRVPMIVRFPERFRSLAPAAPGGTCDRLVTFVDFGPTMLSLAGVPQAPHFQGKPFLGAAAAPPREYVHGFRDRMDERTDLLRCVRDARWKYIRNYRPDRPWSQHIGYMYEMPTMAAWKRLHDEGKLDPVQDRFFRPKPPEELYDTDADPWEVKNLAGEPAHAATLDRMRAELRRWQLEIRDLGALPEADLRSRFGAVAPYEAMRGPAPAPLERIWQAAEAASLGNPPALDDPDPAIRYWAVVARRIRGDAVAPLGPLLGDPVPAVRIETAALFGLRGETGAALPVLEAGLADEEEAVRLQAAQALDDLAATHPAAREAFRKLGKAPGEYVRRLAEHALKGGK
jgi:uncharacterized sulfatase